MHNHSFRSTIKIKLLICTIAFVFINVCSYAQSKTNITWWNPAKNDFNVIAGQGWPNAVESSYDRLPKKAEPIVRKTVWNLSRHSAGLKINFRTNAKNIMVRYKTNASNYAMPHMPATGVSGVDLYAKDSNDDWLWYRGNYSFADTIRYNFKNINLKEEYHSSGREYHLYLPLYNAIQWLEIGVPEDALFEPMPICKEQPIVVYGTSIAQGACASRPGMAWTSILERKLDRPLINLGFSGNGRLEEEVINLITEIEAKVYVLDCLPNLGTNKNRTMEEVQQLIIAAVEGIREKHPLTPILLVEHAGYADGQTNIDRFNNYTSLNKTLRISFAQLKTGGLKNIYLLPKSEIALHMDSFVDGTHPTDLGMMQYALAYEKRIREILASAGIE